MTPPVSGERMNGGTGSAEASRMMFHVVHIQYRGRHRGYEVWHNNRPVVRLRDGVVFKRRDAYELARAWNRGIDDGW